MRNHRTLLATLIAAALLAVASYAGIKPSANATRQEVESDTTLAVKGVLDIESGGALKFAGSSFAPSSYAALAGADFVGPVSVTIGNEDSYAVTGPDGSSIAMSCSEGDCTVTITGSGGGIVTLAEAGSSWPIDMTVGSNTIQISATEINLTGTLYAANCYDYGVRADYSEISTPSECDRFFDTTIHAPCFYNGSAWKSVLDGTTGCTAGA